MLKWTGERYLPWIESGAIHYEHLHRYAFARQFVKDKNVIDLACGEGYGTALLAEGAAHVVGIDIDEKAIKHASSRYVKDNLEFIQGSITNIPIADDNKFDVAVCFEAIEHITKHENLLSEVKRVLRDDGLLIISTPNKAVYTDAPDVHNPFHLKELYLDQFEGLLNRYFNNVRVLGQRVYTGSDIWAIGPHKPSSFMEVVVQKSDNELHFTGKESKEPVYLVALASNSDLDNTLFSDYSRLTDLSDSIYSGYQTQITELSAEIKAKDAQMLQINRGIIVQVMSRFRVIIDKLLRPGTKPRDCYELGLTGMRVILNEGWRSFFRQARKHFTRSANTALTLPKFNASISKKEARKLIFPVPSEKPEVSIIIPAYNNCKYTLNCLKSISENTEDNFEVIVIDDASTDGTAGILSEIKNLRLIENKLNSGFVDSCNRGAKASMGQYILFLNNDTMVTRNWLSPMLDLIKRADVGAVGSKLVYPDGTLQHAGGIMWSDGIAVRYGCGDDEAKPEYNYVREVDFCVGACLLVKRELF
jgi:ubiquinone/menaquinone biosynthesis C-methylase UbiE